MAEKTSGFTLETKKTSAKAVPLAGALGLPLFLLCLMGCAVDMAGRGELWWLGLISAAVCMGLNLVKPRFPAVGLFLASGIGLFLLGDGLGAFANQLFRQSMAVQPYEYDLFSSAREALLIPALAAAATGLGALGRLLRRQRAGLSLALAVCLAGSCAYFGVSPSPLWILLTGMSLVWATADRSSLPKLAVGLAAWSAVAVIVFWVLPPAFPPVRSAEAALRDSLALHTVYYSQTADSLSPTDAESPALPEQLDVREEPEFRQDFQWDSRSILILLILITLLILFVPAVLSDRLKKRIGKNRACFLEKDPAAAVVGMFQFGMKMSEFVGVSIGNRPYGAVGEDISQALPELEGFGEMVELWQEAAFSSHPITGEQRKKMQEFVTALETAVLRKCSRRTRAAIKYRHALWGGSICRP